MRDIRCRSSGSWPRQSDAAVRKGSVLLLYAWFSDGIDPQTTIDFWKMVAVESQWRAEPFAAVGNERFRWTKAHPQLHFMMYYRYLEQYAGLLSSQTPFGRRKHRSRERLAYRMIRRS
jgi:hypothetical protein